MSEHTLTITNIHKSYGTKEILKGVSFAIAPGEIVGFVGPNGCGKTTTLKIVAGLVHPDAGSVHIGGRRLSGWPVPSQVVSFAIDPHSFHPGRTVRDTVRMSAALSGKTTADADQAIAAVGLESAAKKYISALSTGMRQRVALAHALVPDPQILVLDEPLNGLDVDTVVWLNGLLQRRAAAGRSVLLSSHLLNELASVATSAVVLDSGLVVHNGSLDLGDADEATPACVVTAVIPEALAQLAARCGWHVEPGPDGALVISQDSAIVFQAAADARVVLTSLVPGNGKTLTQRYQSLVNGEYAAG